MHRLATFVLVVLVGASCGEATEDPAASPDSAVNGPGCQVLHEPGESEGVGHYGDIAQPYRMVVPATYAQIAPAPLYVLLTPDDGDHDAFMEGWRPYLDNLDGLMIVVNTETSARSQADALASLVDRISSEYCVDSRRVHVLGTSHSFGMAEKFACEYSDRVASFVAAMGPGYSIGDCLPVRAVPLLTFTGDADRSGVLRLVDKWVEINGCNPKPKVEDLGSGVRRKTYQNCAADVLFYDIEGMGHTWPFHEAKGPAAVWVTEYDEVDYLEEAYEFFAAHPLP